MDSEVRCETAHSSLCSIRAVDGKNAIKLARPTSPGLPAHLTSIAFNRLGQYASCPGQETTMNLYAQLAVSPIALAVSVA